MVGKLRARGPLLVVLVQLVALLVVAGVSAGKVQKWSPIDEAAHYDFVQHIAEDGRLPVMGNPNHPEVRAIFFGTYPQPAADLPYPPLVNRSYEAFQPPLYYLLAAPAFLTRSDHFDKIAAVRWFDVLLLFVAVGMTALLARAMLGARWLLGLAAGLCVLLLPGVVVRGVTISPQALEIVCFTALMAVLWRIAQGGGRRWVLATGALLGALALTKITLVYVVPLWLVVCGLDLVRRRDFVAPIGAVAIACVLLAPWLIFNHSNYGSLTGNEQGQDLQRYMVNPTNRDLGIGEAWKYLRAMPNDLLPGEFSGQFDVGWIKVALLVLVAVLVLGWLAALVRGNAEQRRMLLFVGLPVLCGLVLLAFSMMSSDWPILRGRYLYAALPAFAVGLAAAVPQRVAWGGVAVFLTITGILWVDMAGAFYFTNVGDALGI